MENRRDRLRTEDVPSLTDADASLVKGMLARGDRQSDIAAFFGVNGGRISEINTGTRHRGAIAARLDQLPPPGPYLAGRSALRARDMLLSLREQIDAALEEIERFEQARDE